MPTDDALDAIPNNLPIQVTSFVGRDGELSELKQLLPTTRLLTLTGAGGTGKTRLSLQLASEVADGFADGVWFVELAPVADPALVPNTVASVLGVREEPGRPLMTTLLEWLRTRQLLIVLDNCEHLIDACARFADAALHANRETRILATSREALGIAGELAWRVPSLPFPDPHAHVTLAHIEQYPSLRLFVDRARFAFPSFSFTDSNLPAIAQICRGLEGIPLAIELAASRVKMLSVEQIAGRLDDSLQLLTGGSRLELPRHQTLRAAIDWSYDLLTDAEQAALRQLSVFAGSWLLEAADAVLQTDSFDRLAALVDKSLVVVEQREGVARYRMLETIRQYAREKLDASGDLQSTRDRHLNHYLALVEHIEPGLLAGDPERLQQIEAEYSNIREALEYALAANLELAVRLALSLTWFWTWRNRAREGANWALRLLPLTEVWGPGLMRGRALGLAGETTADVPEYAYLSLGYSQASLEMARAAKDTYQIAWSLYQLSVLALRAGDWAQMRTYSEESRALFTELGIMWGASNTSWQLGHAAYKCGEYDTARTLFEQSLATAQKERLMSLMAFARNSLGELARLHGDYAAARISYDEAAQLAREMGFHSALSSALISLGRVALHDGHGAEARALLRKSLSVFEGEVTGGRLVRVVEGLAGALAIEGNDRLSAQWFGAAAEARRRAGSKREPPDDLECGCLIEVVRAHLGDAAFNAAWAEGRALTIEQAVVEAQLVAAVAPGAPSEPAPPPTHPAGLTEREVEVLRLLARGLSNAEIGEQLVVSPRTVGAHLRSIFAKLDVTTRTAAARVAVELKLA